jgi:hypothetical protein
MADKSFGIRQLNLIGESGTANITSPNNLNLNASNVAISTDVTVGRHLDVDGHAEFDAVNVAGVSTFAGTRGQTSIKFYMHSSSHSYGFSFIGVDSPGASGSYTYGAQASAQGGETLYVNRTQINSDLTDSYEHRAASHLTLMEIAS